MTLGAQTGPMFQIAYITQIQMRRSLQGALASDPVVPERRPHRPARDC